MAKAVWRPVSVRLLVPELDDALGVNGQVVDWLHSCYGSSYLIDGVEVQYEYYFTTSTSSYFDPRLPTAFWDRDWDPQCDFIYNFDGTNPCPYTGLPVPVRPFPSTWENPEIISEPGNVIAADSDKGDLWWH